MSADSALPPSACWRGLSHRERLQLLPFLGLALLFAALAVTGAFLSYSPVPFWDSWDGTLNFHFSLQDGDGWAWFEQHNEHRIVLSRLLFWMDTAWFGGTAKFLIVCNYLLAGLSYGLLWWLLKLRLDQPQDHFARCVLGCVLACLMFSWVQAENLVWGFQSQFFLAQSLPLCGFGLLYLASLGGPAAGRRFAMACVLGVLSAGSIASGVLALPLLTLLALLLSLPLKRVAVLALLSLLVVAAYLHGYTRPEGHGGSLGTALSGQPLEFVQYLLMYLGAPLALTEPGTPTMALLAGAVVLLVSLAFAALALRDRRANALELSLLAFVLYIGGTAVGTAGGRLGLGVLQAVSSRYTTPVLTAWSVLLILAAPLLARLIRRKPGLSLGVLALLPLIFTAMQCAALRDRQEILSGRMVSALALELGIRDSEQVQQVYPRLERVMPIAQRAAAQDESVFADPRIHDAGRLLGQRVDADGAPGCIGALDLVFLLEDPRWVRLRGWLFAPQAKAPPQSLLLLDAERRVVGYAVTGLPRADVAAAAGSRARHSGYAGYLLEPSRHARQLIARGRAPDCETTLDLTPAPAAP